MSADPPVKVATMTVSVTLANGQRTMITINEPEWVSVIREDVDELEDLLSPTDKTTLSQRHQLVITVRLGRYGLDMGMSPIPEGGL